MNNILKVHSLTKIGDYLIFSEWYRAISLVDISDITEPKYINCLPYIGLQMGQIGIIDNYIIACANKVLFLIDINDNNGLILYNIEDSKLKLIGNYLQDESFKPQNIFLGRDKLYLIGYGYDDDRDYWVLDKKNPNNVLVTCEIDGGRPKLIKEAKDSVIMFHSHYRCSIADGKNPPVKTFTMYETDENNRYIEKQESDDDFDVYCSCMDDIKYWEVIDDILYASQGSE